MATLKQAIEKALAAAAKANAEAETTERTLVSDPWWFLDLEHGDERLRCWMEQTKRKSDAHD